MLNTKIGAALLATSLLFSVGPASAQYDGDTSRDPGEAPIATPPTPTTPRGTVGSGVRSSPQAKSPSGTAVKKPDDSDDRRANESRTRR